MFRSILFEGESPRVGAPADPEVLRDLDLDQIVRQAIGKGDDAFVRPLYLAALADAEAVRYRQEVCTDLEDAGLRGSIATFGDRMTRVRALLDGGESTHRYQRLPWMVDAAQRYGQAVRELADALAGLHLRSRGLAGLRDHLAAHAHSGRLRTLLDDAASCRESLDGVHYNLRLDGFRVRVLPFRGEPDYGAEIEDVFARFGRGATRERDFRFEAHNMSGVDEQIVDRVARLYPEVFAQLERFGERHIGFVDEIVGRFGREVAFYLGYLDLVEPLRTAGLRFCYPEVAPEGEIEASAAFDLALALRLSAEGRLSVPNDFALRGPERILVVTGPNQGGKTTFARMFGQVHHLACLGLPVPGTFARLRLFDRVYTHFDRPERAEDLTGKLEDDLLRLHAICEAATDRSIVIMNESLTSTTIDDALAISRDVIGALIERGTIGVCVTFLDELSRLGDATVSMVAEIGALDLADRTYLVQRRPADGLAYAAALAAKYGVTYGAVRQKVSA